MIILFLGETSNYFTTYESAEMYIDVDRDGEKVKPKTILLINDTHITVNC